MYEDFSYLEMKTIRDAFKESMKKTHADLYDLGKKKHHELDAWMTPLEREMMLDECLQRGLKDEMESEITYRRVIGW